MPCTCHIPEDQAQIFLRWDCCMFFCFCMWRCVWGKFNQEPSRPKRSLTIDTISKSICQITSTGQKKSKFYCVPHFWTIFVIWSKNGPLLFNLYHDPPERCLCFLLDLGFWHFFTQLRNPDLWFMMLVIWYVLLLVQMWLLEVESFSIPGICPTSDVAEQKLITFLGEVGGSFKTPSRWWLLLWLLRVNTGNPCRWDTHLGNMRLSHLSKTCPWKNDLGWNDLPWAELWWNLRKGLARVLALSIRGIQGCIWISHDSVADLYGHFPAWQGLSLESNYTLLPWHELSRLGCFSLEWPKWVNGKKFF